MGEMVSFPSNGGTADGYLAVPASGSGPGVLVLQEWWGLAPQLKRVCDRLAEEGFVAIAPDLYHGELAEHTEMDKAAKLMSEMPMDRAGRDMGAAVDFLLAHEPVTIDVQCGEGTPTPYVLYDVMPVALATATYCPPAGYPSYTDRATLAGSYACDGNHIMSSWSFSAR